jgi:hypothetical protein
LPYDLDNLANPMTQRARIVICDRRHLFVLMIDRFALSRRFGHHGRGGRRRSCCE